MKPYEQYKHSGIDWLGQVPSHWEVKKLKYVLQLSNEKTESQKSDLRYIGMENIVSNTGELTETILEAEGVANIFHQNEILFGKLRPYLAKVYLAQMDGICSTEFLVYKTSKQIFNKFAFYLMICPSFIETVNSSTYGTKMPRANSDFLANLNIAIPPLPEQTAIAKFLDEKTTQIQTAIEIKNEQIAKLKEYRQALINQTVTKGLNANAPMRRVGLSPPLDEIPVHWEVKKLKFITSKIGSGVTPSGGALNYLDSGIPLLRSQNVHFDGLDLKDVAFISEKTHHSMFNSQVKKGDILLNITGGSIGRCYYVDTDDEMNVNQHVCIVRPKTIETKFLNYVLASDIGQGQVWYFQQGGGREGLNFQALKNFYIPYPNISEQLAIAEFLDEKTAQIDKAIAHQQNQIERLKEYQQSLVNDVVTGKIRVKQD